jgi:hypothetical protein
VAEGRPWTELLDGGTLSAMGLFRSKQTRGDAVLEALATGKANPQTRALFQAVRADGVTDDDIRTWWNFSDAHQRKTAEAHSVLTTAVYLAKTEEGAGEEDAVAYSLRSQPCFGDRAIRTAAPT